MRPVLPGALLWGLTVHGSVQRASANCYGVLAAGGERVARGPWQRIGRAGNPLRKGKPVQGWALRSVLGPEANGQGRRHTPIHIARQCFSLVQGPQHRVVPGPVAAGLHQPLAHNGAVG